MAPRPMARGLLAPFFVSVHERTNAVDARGPLGDRVVVLCGSAHPSLAGAVARELGATLALGAQRFPDGEIYAEIGADVRGRHAAIVQPTGQPGGEYLLELLLVADACRRAGAHSLSAVIPYLGYARQEHRTHPGQALGMRVVGEMLGLGRFGRLVMLDLHADAVEGFLAAPVEHLTAASLLAEAARPYAERAVVVSPDLGGVKRARECARLLDLPFAIVHKTRMSPTEVTAERVLGDVRDLRPILFDDMISTGGTLVAAARALLAAGCAREITAVATHALLVPPAAERLHEIGLRRLIVTNSLPGRTDLPFPCEVIDVAPLLAASVRRVVAAA